MVALPAHLPHRLQHPLGAGQQLDRAGQVTDLGGPFAAHAVEVADVHEAGHRVVAALDHGVAGVRRGVRLGADLGERALGVQEGHLGARDHHLAQLALARGEHIGDQRPLVVPEFGVGGDQAAELLRAHRAPARGRVAAEQPDHQVGGTAEQPDRRAQHHRHDVDHRRRQQGDGVGALEADPLRGELAEHQRDVADHQGQPDQGGGVGDALGQPGPDEQRGHLAGQGVGAERGGEEAHAGHADLDGRQEAVRVGGEVRGPGRPPGAACLQRPDLSLAQRDQRDLGDVEQAAQDDEDEDERGVLDGFVHSGPV